MEYLPSVRFLFDHGECEHLDMDRLLACPDVIAADRGALLQRSTEIGLNRLSQKRPFFNGKRWNLLKFTKYLSRASVPFRGESKKFSQTPLAPTPP